MPIRGRFLPLAVFRLCVLAQVALSQDEDANPAPSTAGLGTLLPESIQDKLAGMLGGMGDLDPQVASLLSALLPNAGIEAGEAEEEEDDGTSEDLAGLLAAAGLRGAGGELMKFEDDEATYDLEASQRRMEEAMQRRKEAEAKMEAAAREREEWKRQREIDRAKEREETEKDKAERELERAKQREEFEEGRRKHAAYMESIRERREASAAKKERQQEEREAREERTQATLEKAYEEIERLATLQAAEKFAQKAAAAGNQEL